MSVHTLPPRMMPLVWQQELKDHHYEPELCQRRLARNGTLLRRLTALDQAWASESKVRAFEPQYIQFSKATAVKEIEKSFRYDVAQLKRYSQELGELGNPAGTAERLRRVLILDMVKFYSTRIEWMPAAMKCLDHFMQRPHHSVMAVVIDMRQFAQRFDNWSKMPRDELEALWAERRDWQETLMEDPPARYPSGFNRRICAQTESPAEENSIRFLHDKNV